MKILICILLLAATACAQVSLMPVPHVQFLGPTAQPLAGGFVFTFAAGTTTPLASFADSTGTVFNPNPIVLDSGGFANIWFTAGVPYKIVVQDSSGNQQWTADNIYGVGGTNVVANTVNATNYLVNGVALSSANLSDSNLLVRYTLPGTFSALQNFGTVGFQFNGTASGTTTVVPPSAAGAFTLTWPSIIGNDTLATLGLTETFTGAVTFAAAATFSSTATFNGNVTLAALRTTSNCTSSVDPAPCGSASAGAVTMAAAAGSRVVNTTAVTSNSEIFVFEASDIGTRLGVTCNTTTGRVYSITNRTAGASFTIGDSAAPAVNPACLTFLIVN